MWGDYVGGAVDKGFLQDHPLVDGCINGLFEYHANEELREDLVDDFRGQRLGIVKGADGPHVEQVRLYVRRRRFCRAVLV